MSSAVHSAQECPYSEDADSRKKIGPLSNVVDWSIFLLHSLFVLVFAATTVFSLDGTYSFKYRLCLVAPCPLLLRTVTLGRNNFNFF